MMTAPLETFFIKWYFRHSFWIRYFPVEYHLAVSSTPCTNVRQGRQSRSCFIQLLLQTQASVNRFKKQVKFLFPGTKNRTRPEYNIVPIVVLPPIFGRGFQPAVYFLRTRLSDEDPGLH